MTHHPDGHCGKCGTTLTVKPCLNCRERDKLLGNTDTDQEVNT